MITSWRSFTCGKNIEASQLKSQEQGGATTIELGGALGVGKTQELHNQKQKKKIRKKEELHQQNSKDFARGKNVEELHN